MLIKPKYPPETLCVIRGQNVIPEGPKGLSGTPLHVIVGKKFPHFNTNECFF